MKARCIAGTTLRGKPLNVGDIVELDPDTFRLLKGDVVEYVEPPKPQVVVTEESQRATKKGK